MYEEETEIETDPKVIAEQEIIENANSVDFDDDDSEILGEDGRPIFG